MLSRCILFVFSPVFLNVLSPPKPNSAYPSERLNLSVWSFLLYIPYLLLSWYPSPNAVHPANPSYVHRRLLFRFPDLIPCDALSRIILAFNIQLLPHFALHSLFPFFSRSCWSISMTMLKFLFHHLPSFGAAFYSNPNVTAYTKDAILSPFSPYYFC